MGRSGFGQVELFGFGETEEMKQCRAAQNKLEPLLRIYFDSSWRKIDNEASATLHAPHRRLQSVAAGPSLRSFPRLHCPPSLRWLCSGPYGRQARGLAW